VATLLEQKKLTAREHARELPPRRHQEHTIMGTGHDEHWHGQGAQPFHIQRIALIG
jgi:hypothetical protein